MNAYMSKIYVGSWVRRDTKMDDSLVSLIQIVLCRGARTMLKEQHGEGLSRGNEGFVEEAFFEPWYKEGWYSQVKGKARWLYISTA